MMKVASLKKYLFILLSLAFTYSYSATTNQINLYHHYSQKQIPDYVKTIANRSFNYPSMFSYLSDRMNQEFMGAYATYAKMINRSSYPIAIINISNLNTSRGVTVYYTIDDKQSFNLSRLFPYIVAAHTPAYILMHIMTLYKHLDDMPLRKHLATVTKPYLTQLKQYKYLLDKSHTRMTMLTENYNAISKELNYDIAILQLLQQTAKPITEEDVKQYIKNVRPLLGIIGKNSVTRVTEIMTDAAKSISQHMSAGQTLFIVHAAAPSVPSDGVFTTALVSALKTYKINVKIINVVSPETYSDDLLAKDVVGDVIGSAALTSIITNTSFKNVISTGTTVSNALTSNQASAS